MNPRSRLCLLGKTATGKIARQRRVFYRSLRSEERSVRNALTCSAVIELHNTWLNFSRCFYLAIAVNAKSSERGHVTCANGFGSHQLALHAAINVVSPWVRPNANGIYHRRDEPPWHDTSVLLRAVAPLGCSLSGNVTSALSTGTRVFLDLPVMRNYVAHRNASTRKAAQDLALFYGMSSRLNPIDLLAARPATRPQPLIEDWMDDVSTVIELLCD